MSSNVKNLLFTTSVLLAVIAGIAAATMAHADGATIFASLKAGAIGFSGGLTLLVGILTAYTVM